MTKALTEVLEECGLPPGTTQAGAIQHLRTIQKANHPDGRGGVQFNDPASKAAYLRATALVERLAKKPKQSTSGRSLVVSERNALAQLTEQNALQQQQLAVVRADQSKERARTALERAVTQPLRVIKFNSWGLGALAIIFAALKDQIVGLEQFIGDAASAQIGLSCFIVGSLLAVFGVVVQLQEGEQSSRAAGVLTDDGIRSILMALKDEFGAVAQETISLDQLIDRVQAGAHIRDFAAAQAAAESIVDRLLARDLISPLPERYFSPTYKISLELERELIRLGTAEQPWSADRRRRSPFGGPGFVR